MWFRSTDFGDDKDRVLVKADGEFTYFAADIAYHKDKFDRGFDRVIDIWGADHHGYVARMKAAVAALGHPGQLDVVIGQLVNLLRGGEVVRMSKRTGEMVTFEDLLDEVGADAARYFFLRRSTDQPLDFDIELAKQQIRRQPRLLRAVRARAHLLDPAQGRGLGPRTRSTSPTRVRAPRRRRVRTWRRRPVAADRRAEFTLIRKISEFPEVVEGAADAISLPTGSRATPRTSRRRSTSSTRVCRVMSEDAALDRGAALRCAMRPRLTLERVLALVGVSAPERM